MEVVAGDSGVETEFDIESNDSSMSGLSGGALPVPLQPLPEVSIIIMIMIIIKCIVLCHYHLAIVLITAIVSYDSQAIEEAATNSPHPPSPAPMPGSSLPGLDDDDGGHDGDDDDHDADGFGNDVDNDDDDDHDAGEFT